MSIVMSHVPGSSYISEWGCLCVCVCMYVSLYVDGSVCDNHGSCVKGQMYISVSKLCEFVDMAGGVRVCVCGYQSCVWGR